MTTPAVQEQHDVPSPKQVNERRSWARIVSDLLSPPVVWAVLAYPIAFYGAASTGQALAGAAVYGLFVCVLPALYIAYMVHRGKITDIHIRLRKQRIIPFLVTMGSTAIGLLVLVQIGAPDLIVILSALTLIEMLLMLVVTLFWQISLHALGISTAVVAMGVLYGGAIGLLLSPLIVLVGVARVVLRRHTTAQVIAGAIVGISLTLAIFRWLSLV